MTVAARAAAKADPPLRGLWLFLLAVGGAFLGVAVIGLGAWSWTKERKDFALSGSFLLWASLICAQTAAWTVAVPLLAGIRRGLDRLWARDIVVAAFFFCLVVLIGVFGGALGPHWAGWDDVKDPYGYLDHRWLRISILGIVGTLVAMYGVLAIWAIYRELKAMLLRGNLGLGDVDDYLALQDKLQLLLVILGGALGLTILAVGAERNAILEWTQRNCPTRSPVVEFVLGTPSCPSHFPPEFMLIYGFFFTALLALAYIPAQLALASVGRRIRDTVASLEGLNAHNLAGRRAKRDALESLLDLKVGTAASFRSGLAILTPLIGSLTALLFGAAH
jgi:hypothetical protein